MARRPLTITRDHVILTAGVVCLIAVTFGSVVWGREVDGILGLVIIGALGIPVYNLGDLRRRGDDDR